MTFIDAGFTGPNPWRTLYEKQNPKKAAPKPKLADLNAKQLLAEFLDGLGLHSLVDWAWNTYTNAGGDEYGNNLVVAELPNQQAFKVRFPAIGERVKKGLQAISPGDYLAYETTIRQAFSAHGLPLPDTGPAFDNIITDLLVNDVSAQEVVNQRIGSAFDRVANAPVEVRQAAASLWGINGNAALAAFFLDPNRSAPELEKLSQSFEIAGTAKRFGIDLNADRAERLADLGADQNLGGFGQLAKLSPLFRENVGERTDLTLEGAGVSAAFGEDAASEVAVSRRLAERKAALDGGGGPFESGSGAGGLAGLGSGSG